MWRTMFDLFKEFLDFVGRIDAFLWLLAFIGVIVAVIRGIFPIWYRLGRALSNRRIAVFAEEDFEALKSLLADSKIFRQKNIVRIDKQSLKKAETFSLFLVHWKPFQSEIGNILALKKNSAALIIYAPQNEGFIDGETLQKINSERNATIVNFRGRLLNDILTSMITTSYE